MDKCYDEISEIDFKSSGLYNFEGKQIDEKWVDKDRHNSRILRAMSSELHGYINIYHHQMENIYSLKMGGESPATAGGSVMIPGAAAFPTGGSPASSTTFNGSLSRDLHSAERSNLFDKILEKTEMQFNIPYYGQKKFIALSKDYYFKVD